MLFNFKFTRQKTKVVLVILFACMSVFRAAAQNATDTWYMVTDTQERIPMDNVDFLLAADGNTYFSVITKDSKEYDGVTRVTFSKETSSGVDRVEAGGGLKVSPIVATSELNVTGCARGERIAVVSTTGQTCIVTKADDGNATVDVSSLAKGTYILMVGKQTVKFIKH